MTLEAIDLMASMAVTANRGDLGVLGELFLENTKLHPHAVGETSQRIIRYFADPVTIGVTRHAHKAYVSARRVALPPVKQVESPTFDQVIRSRRSAMLNSPSAFGERSLTIDELSAVLFYSYGITRTRGKYRPDQPITESPLRQRTVPSPGALYPLELYAVVIRVMDVETGVYHYNVLRHRLERVADLPRDLQEELFAGGADIGNAGAVLFTTALPSRLVHKYGHRAYRYVLIEAGHVAQNTCLGAASLGLSCCPVGGFVDDAVHDVLGVNGLDELVVYATVIGTSTSSRD